MKKPRIIIADTDVKYITPLKQKFVSNFFNKIELEIITDCEYFKSFFTSPQKAEILIVSEELYDSSIQKHNIANIFIMSDQNNEEKIVALNTLRLFKYSSINLIFNEIIGKSADALKTQNIEKKDAQIVLITSASGGVGKTTVAMGICSSISKNYKRVLYINASRLQTFHQMFTNDLAINSLEVYSKLIVPNADIYDEIKKIIRKESFSYLPPFKAALMSLGIQYSVYENIAICAKNSKEYDFIVIDAETTFDENKARLFDISDKVLIITDQSTRSAHATNRLISNINGINLDKYIFVCNNYKKELNNALVTSSIASKFVVNEYIEHFDNYDQLKIDDFSNNSVVQKLTLLVL